MKSITDVEEIGGKTILAVYHQFSDLVIRFTDGTFIAFQSELGYESSHSIEINGSVEDYILRDAGVMSDEEYETHVENVRKRQAEQREARERREYETLKMKYGKP